MGEMGLGIIDPSPTEEGGDEDGDLTRETREGQQAQKKKKSISQSPVQAMGVGVFYRPTHGEYTLAPVWRDWAFQQLGIPNHRVKVDLFASKARTSRPLFVTKSMDAFTFNWGRLVEEEEDFLWANPPFYFMEKVVAKIWQEPCRLVLCYPEKQEAVWWQPLQTLVRAGVSLPDGQSLYYGVIKKDILPPPGWKSMVSLVESKGDRGPYPNQKVADWLNSRCQQRGLEHLKQAVAALHHQGGSGPEDPGGTGRPPGDGEAGHPPGKTQEEGGGKSPPLWGNKARKGISLAEKKRTLGPSRAWE